MNKVVLVLSAVCCCGYSFASIGDIVAQRREHKCNKLEKALCELEQELSSALRTMHNK